jgi:type I restriction enzyme S subunit
MPHLDDGVPVVRGEHIQHNGHLSLDWSDYWHVSEDVSAKFPKTVLQRGDLVMSVRGSIGKLGIVGAEHDGAQLSPNCIRFAPTKAVESRYLFLFLRSPLGQEKMSGHSAATAIATIRASNIKNVALPVPPLPEQRRIASKLDALQEEVDTLKRLQAETAAELDSLLPSILDKAFKGEL